MSDQRSGSDIPGPLRGADTEVPIDEDVLDLSDTEGPELTTNVDDIDPGSAVGAPKDAGAEPPD